MLYSTHKHMRRHVVDYFLHHHSWNENIRRLESYFVNKNVFFAATVSVAIRQTLFKHLRLQPVNQNSIKTRRYPSSHASKSSPFECLLK